MRRFTLCLLVLLAVAVCVAVGSAPAYAVDGVVLINQNTAISGLPGCGTSPSTLIIICQPGSYRLSGNLVVPANTGGISITTNDVILDLNGFTISGPLVCSPAPPTCTGFAGSGIFTDFNNIAVRNGVVRGCFNGLALNGQNSTVEEVTATGNFNVGIGIASGLLRRNIASFNGAGLNANDATVTENVAIGNVGHGLFISQGVYGSNTLSGNGTPVINGSAVSQGNNYCGSTTPC